ncbi:MAG: hypothetical protein RLZZ15_4261 [Verrucomicrobiota bacterium]
MVRIYAHPPLTDAVLIEEEAPAEAPRLQFIFQLHGRLIASFQLRDDRGRAAVTINRKHEAIFDEAQITDDWVNPLPLETRTPIYVRLHNLLEKHLRVGALEAALSGGGESDWNQYRDSHLAILSSLEQTNQRLLVDTAKQIEAVRSSEAQKNEELRRQLKGDFASEQTRLASEHDQKQKALAAREQALEKKLAEFETKESKYVARQEAKNQLAQLKEWLEDSSLTEKTVEKRRPVLIGYIFAILATGALTGWLSYENVQILKNAGPNLPQVPWWQWLGLTLKTVVPLAAFTTFLIYFIRWEADWARQHSDEELRTRARVVDIGRSSWLVEAVRDSQGSADAIPKELLEQLAKNLFANPTSDASGTVPKSGAEILMQQLSSLRLKTPDGAEIEATTSDSKKK